MAESPARRIAGRCASGVLALLALGCGSKSNDEIPEELLAAIAAGQASGGDYPEGPYGSEIGDVAQDVCIRAWTNPQAADYAASELEPLCFSDFYDPEAEKNALLLVNTSAIWCQACRTEYAGSSARPSLSEEVAERYDSGLRIMGVLFQGVDREPATERDAELWAQTFEVDFAFGLDESFAMGAFADPQKQPFNMVLDTRTMEIALVVEEDDPRTLWPAIDSLLP